MSNLFNRFSWGGSGGGGGGGAGRGGHRPRRPLGLGAPRPSISFEDEQDYDTADDGRDYYPPVGRPASQRGLSPSEYEAQRNAIFSTGAADGYMDSGAGGGQNMPPPPPGGQGTLSLAQGTAGPPDLTAQDGGGPNQAQLPPFAPPQQGAAQIAVQPAAGLGRSGAGTAQPPTGTGPTGTPPQDFLGIASALERLAPLMTDADTARNLRWQREVDGDKNKLVAWKLEATGSAGLCVYATGGGVPRVGT